MFSGFYVPKSLASSTSSRTTSVCTKPDSPDPTHEDDSELRDELTDRLDQCELEEGWTTVPKKKGPVEDEVEEMLLPDDVLIAAGNVVRPLGVKFQQKLRLFLMTHFVSNICISTFKCTCVLYYNR